MVTEDHAALLSLEKAGRSGERPKHGDPDATKSAAISFNQRSRPGQRTQRVKRFWGTTRAPGGPCQSLYIRGLYESASAIFLLSVIHGSLFPICVLQFKSLSSYFLVSCLGKPGLKASFSRQGVCLPLPDSWKHC